MSISDEPMPKPSHVGAPAVFELEMACQIIDRAFRHPKHFSGIFLVGSAITRPDWRDVDVRMILADAYFAELFPNADQHWEHDERWLLQTCSISLWLKQKTGLPIDFQFQPMTHANSAHSLKDGKIRHALGMRFAQKDERWVSGEEA